jgi:hypothetical protein
MSENKGAYPDRAGQRYGRFGNSTQRPNSRRLLGLRFYALLDGLYRLGRPGGATAGRSAICKPEHRALSPRKLKCIGTKPAEN